MEKSKKNVRAAKRRLTKKQLEAIKGGLSASSLSLHRGPLMYTEPSA